MPDAFEQEIIKLIKKKKPNVDEDAIHQWMDSSSFWANWNNKHSVRWIEELLCNLNKNKSNIHPDRFFTLATGLLHDLPENYFKKIEIFIPDSELKKVSLQDLFIMQITNDISMRDHLITIANVHDILKSLESKLTEEQFFAVIFFRNSFSHPTLDGYMVKLRKGVRFDAQRYAAWIKFAPTDMLEVFDYLHAILLENKIEIENLLSNLKKLT